MARVLRTIEDLEARLQEQLALLKLDAKNYDEGVSAAAISMAARLRVLLEEGKTNKGNKSLLGQLGLKDTTVFLSSAFRRGDNLPANMVEVGSFLALVNINNDGSSVTYVPHLDELPLGKYEEMTFDEYWNQEIFLDGLNNHFTRSEIIEFAALQDGGQHEDPSLTQKYAELTRKNSLGWKVGNAKEWKDLVGAERASIRQIAHEVLRSLKVDYHPPKPTKAGITIGGASIRIGTVPTDESGMPIRRKGPCICGSGKKYKRCCGS